MFEIKETFLEQSFNIQQQNVTVYNNKWRYNKKLKRNKIIFNNKMIMKSTTITSV